MIRAVLLDSGPLGRLAHPRPNAEITAWLDGLLATDVIVIAPEIADYEVRRSLLLADLSPSVARLDGLKEVLTYLPLNTEVMLKAAELWAAGRKRGQPTADPKELDGDVILAAQALQVGAVIATENVAHLAQFVPARHWREVVIEGDSA